MEGAVERVVHGVDGAHQRDDLIDSLEAVGLVDLGAGVEHPHSEVLHGAQGGDGGQLDALLLRKDLQLGQNFLARVHADDVRVSEFPVFH